MFMKTKEKICRRKSLLWSMLFLLLFGWFLPLLVTNGIMSIMATRKVHTQIDRSVTTSMEKAAEIMELQLAESETASKNASYLNVIREAYLTYQDGGNRRDFQTTVFTFLEQQYMFHKNCQAVNLVFREYPDDIYYTYNNSTGGTYRDITYFKTYVAKDLLEEMDDLDTRTELRSYDGRLYMIRNLVDSKFHPFAILAIELNEESLMESLKSVWGYENAVVYLDGTYALSMEGGDSLHYGEEQQNRLAENDSFIEHASGRQNPYVYKRLKLYHSTLDCVVELDRSAIYAEIKTIRYVYGILAVFALPLVFIIYNFLNKRVNRPVQDLIKVFDVVRAGEYGTQIENMANSEEFYHMEESFNYMSSQLKQQFDKIYMEEIALRDAKIMALQSQINPHFLNNTLEIINWEARLNGNMRVSQMIEALSTMLEATMNRKADPYNTVAEEMEYVDAYLYIITQRYGEKFTCRKEIDESLLNYKIPRLIVQPIAENAIEHGMSITREGELVIRLYRKREDLLCIEIENNRPLSEEDQAKIHKLLKEGPNPQKEHRVSLGIRNVDQRLRMMYGPECGLFISNNKNNHTVSTILVKIDEGRQQ
jgi:HAMP domain-containing protein